MEHILISEGNIPILILMERVAQRHHNGYHTETANDQCDGFEKLQQTSVFDIFLGVDTNEQVVL